MLCADGQVHDVIQLTVMQVGNFGLRVCRREGRDKRESAAGIAPHFDGVQLETQNEVYVSRAPEWN